MRVALPLFFNTVNGISVNLLDEERALERRGEIGGGDDIGGIRNCI